MEATQMQPAAAGSQSARAAARGNASKNQSRAVFPSGSGVTQRKSATYGLPCAICHLYYPADLDDCPTCHSNERVDPVVRAYGKPAQVSATPASAAQNLQQEREEFLREFKSDLVATHAEAINGPAHSCSLDQNHAGEPVKATAEVCQPCYERLQSQLDVCEAALHMDMKEAAQIIYDAVWADPSDPSKTYRNAANALLTELRKRAGMNGVRGPFQPMAH